MFFGLTPKQLKRAAFEFAEKHKIPHRFNKHSRTAGKEWLRGFMKRHPTISLRQPTSTSIARAMGFNRPQVDRFFVKMSALMDKYKFPPQSIYNMDETGISTVPNRPPRVLSIKGKRAVNKIASSERGLNVTAVNAVSATGHFIPPAFIFKRKRMKAELLDGAPIGSIGMVSDSSFINGDLFIDRLSHFKDHTRPSKDHPILLILDKHKSHCSLKAIDFYRQNNIVALTLPPHCSHKMQPLDWGFHGAVEKYYAGECEKWLRNHPGRAITTFQLTSIFTPTFNKAATVACGVDSFKTTGIWPWNPDVFTDAAIEIDDNPAENNSAENQVNTSAVASGSSQTIDLALLDNANDCIIQAPGVPGCSGLSKPSLQDIIPKPRAGLKRDTKRKHKQADVISGSPYKNQLESDIEARKKPKPKLKKAKKVFKKPNTSTKKKIWRCGGCTEIFRELIDEDWIECVKCDVWWHEKCTDYLGFGVFKCDLCK